MNLHSIEAPFMASSKEEDEADRVHKRHRVLLGNARSNFNKENVDERLTKRLHGSTEFARSR